MELAIHKVDLQGNIPNYFEMTEFVMVQGKLFK